MSRPAISLEPPGVAGIVSSTLRSGFQACADALPQNSVEAPARTIAHRLFRALFMSSPFCFKRAARALARPVATSSSPYKNGIQAPS
jgi:hypothetical protein